MYCSIIGYPLSKPRSVLLWKKHFKKKKLKIKMIPAQVKEKKFNQYIKNLVKDKNFLASAITMPFKNKIIKYLDKIDGLAKDAKAVNLIISNKGKLKGFNTDVFGALESIKGLKKKNIAIYGFGGAGSAIYYCLSKKFNKSRFWIVSSKNKKEIIINKNTILKKKIENSFLKEIDLFINCSPLGGNLDKKYKIKTPIDSTSLKMMKKESTIFDIVYKPQKTILSDLCDKNGIRYINGLKMNTLQAEKALGILDSFLKNYKLKV